MSASTKKRLFALGTGGLGAVFGLGVALAVSSAVIVGTGCPSYPTPTNNILGHTMTNQTQNLELALAGIAAVLLAVVAGCLAARRGGWISVLMLGVAVFVLSFLCVFAADALLWHVTCPASAGNGA